MGESTAAATAPPVGARDHAQGPAGAPVTLIVYGDFECPDSLRAYRHIRALRGRLGDRLRVVFRHFPLTHKHPRAFPAAEAAEVAGAQGHFWPMHDRLFAGFPALDDARLADYAAELGLDTARFAADLAGHVHAARVQADLDGGRAAGVPGTPTFFINGAFHDGHDGSYDLERLTAAIAAAERVATA